MKIGVFIGRMQPMHNGHLSVIKYMAEQCDAIIIGIGSSNKAPSTKNPFTFLHRKIMVREAIHNTTLASPKRMGNYFEPEDKNLVSVEIVPIPDYTYNDQMWLETTANIVEKSAMAMQRLTLRDPDAPAPEIVLYGHDQGSDTRYLHLFPQWKKELLGKSHQFHATDIRLDMFFNQNQDWCSKVPAAVTEEICKIFNTPNGKEMFQNLVEEANLVKKIKEDKAKYRYPIIDQTVDAVVICNGHILMVTRGVNPGKGQLALPGGYLNEFEDIRDGIVRELIEETRIQLKPSLLKNLINEERIKTFAAPGRSVRGRIITHCGLINYHSNTLPEVKGSDDAAGAHWIPLNKLDPYANRIFEDHYCIIRNMLGYC